MKAEEEILKENPDLISFHVRYKPSHDKDLDMFQCYAVDKQHAKEQCENAYPGCRVFMVNYSRIKAIKVDDNVSRVLSSMCSGIEPYFEETFETNFIIAKLTIERELLAKALYDIRAGKDNPSYLATKALNEFSPNWVPAVNTPHVPPVHIFKELSRGGNLS